MGRLLGLACVFLALGTPAGGDPPPEDARIPIAVLPLGLTAATHERYPQLAERSVGFGLHAMLVERLFDTGRFRFVEDKPEVVQDLLDRQWVAASGAVAADSAVEHGRLLGARHVVYGEVYAFATRQLDRRRAEVRLAIQVRIVDVETSEYVPASGEATVVREGEVFPGEVELARSTVGEASEEAIAAAVDKLMARFDAARGRGGQGGAAP